MNRRVRSVVAALFALSLVLPAPAAFAARERDRDAGFIQRVVRTVKQVLKPFIPTVQDDDSFTPGPPKP